jgi:thiamine-phosphate pyrophosphorylase
MYSKLQYISQGESAAAQLKNIQEALDAGCRWIQLRFKNASDEDLKNLAFQVKELCAGHRAKFIINDHPHIAKAVNADGVHLGLSDMPVSEARGIVGLGLLKPPLGVWGPVPAKIIGGTANTLEDILRRVDEGCSYIGLGPFRFTQTKEKLSPILGIEGYEKIMSELVKQNITVPVYAIGGIVPDDIPAIMQTGVYGVAVSGVITTHSDKKLLVDQFNSLLYAAANNSR